MGAVDECPQQEGSTPGAQPLTAGAAAAACTTAATISTQGVLAAS